MNIVTLASIVLIQILLVFFTIISMVLFQDNLLNVIGVPIHLIIVILLNFLSLFILASIYKREEKRKIYDAESTHVEEFRSLVSSVRSDRHDLNNHLTVISGLIKINNYEAANKYITEMIGDIRINNKALAINNPILASMLYSKMDTYKNEGITFNITITSESIVNLLSSTDLIRLLSNLLDNAYEATLELPVIQRLVQLEMLELDKNIILKVCNSAVMKEINDDYFKIGKSSKSQSGNRGYGLGIIRKIINKYNGTLLIDTKDNLVSFEISFLKG
jgi:two-component system, LytTR family, sensor histidine kinase AgrC